MRDLEIYSKAAVTLGSRNIQASQERPTTAMRVIVHVDKAVPGSLTIQLLRISMRPPCVTRTKALIT